MVRVLAFPAYSNKKSNPYNYMLYNEIEKYGCKVGEFSFKQALLLKYDLIHIHWPEIYLNSNYRLKAFFGSIAFLFVLFIAKLARKKIVWTVHNLKPHNVKYRLMNSIFWFFYIKMVDGIISLSKANESIALQEFKFKNCIKKSVAHHGLYHEAYENNITKEEARGYLGINEKAKVVLFLGQIKPYKNIEKLITEFNLNQDNDFVLLIAGRFDSNQYYCEVKNIIKSRNIVLVNKFIPDDEIQQYYKAADLCVLPFKNIFNSGSALLSVTFGAKVLVPYSENFREYQEILNDEVINTYKGELSFNIISDRKYYYKNDFGSFNNDFCEWSEIGFKHKDYYEGLVK